MELEVQRIWKSSNEPPGYRSKDDHLRCVSMGPISHGFHSCVKYSREMAGLRLGVTLTGYHCSHVKVQRLPRFADLSCETSEVCSPRQIPTARNQILASRLAL